MADKKLIEKDRRFHESFLKKVGNEIIVFILKIISILPFWIVFGISDFLYVIIKYLVRYRKQVITENLQHAFPEKADDEITKIRNKFYRHFCDLWLETVKMHSMSYENMQKHMVLIGAEKLNKYYDQGRSVVILTFHYNNWEWCTAMQPEVKQQGLIVYNPIRGNHAMEKFLTHSREKWGAKCVPLHRSGREIVKYNLQGKATLAVLAADQTPQANAQFWTTFLNREAPFFSGPEKIAIRGNQPVVFAHTRKLKRGTYSVELIELVAEPKDVDPNEILLRYVRKIEEIIREEPAYYLWSHRRWKHTRPEGIDLTT